MANTAENVIGVTGSTFAVTSASVVFAGLPGAGAAEISYCRYMELDIIDHLWSTILPICRTIDILFDFEASTLARACKA